MKVSLPKEWSRLASKTTERLAYADAALIRDYPGWVNERQPIHTVYIPADRISENTIESWGGSAVEALTREAGSPEALAAATGLDADAVGEVYPRLLKQLRSSPIEDLRLDFEDGYGERSDDEEDADAERAAQVAIQLLQRDPGSFGLVRLGARVKSFDSLTRTRGLRTLGILLCALAEATMLDRRFVITLPKVTSVDQVEALVDLCQQWEYLYRLPSRTIRFEIQVETPQSILSSDGTVLVARMIKVSDQRCVGLHYGTYDYSSFCGVLGRYQSLEHPVADYAKAVMQVAAAGTGVTVSDGSSNRIPVGDSAQVREAWQEHARLVRRSLERGYYQGWDLHPAQLVTRFLVNWTFYREGLDECVERLEAYLGDIAFDGIMDEPATAAALADAVLRGFECGAIVPADLGTLTPESVATVSRRGSFSSSVSTLESGV